MFVERKSFQQRLLHACLLQLKVVNCEKGQNEQKVPQTVKANNSRKISAAKRPDKKGKEVLRGISPKLNQTKR